MSYRPPIRTRLALIASAAVAATALLVCVAAWLILRDVLIHQVDQNLQDIRRGPASNIGPLQALALPNAAMPDQTGFQIQAMLPDGHVVTAPPGAGVASFGAADQAVVDGRTTIVRYTLDTGGTRYRVQTFRNNGGLVIRLMRSLEDQDATLRRVGTLMITLTICAALAAAVAGWSVAAAGLWPVHRLTLAATKVADTRNLQQPIPVDGNDEVAQLGRAFNQMLAALGRSQQAQQQLIEDAAHELRTPMASMRTNVELLIRAGSRLGDADRDALLDDLDRQSIELSDLVAGLVALARSASVDEPAETVDVTRIVAEAIRRASARTPNASFTLTGSPLTARVQPAAIERAVVNLLDNAVKFGAVGQTVEVAVVAVTADAAWFVEISVADRGPGIPAGERDRIFQRFHRSDTARGIPGSGLGLAIVHQTVTAHDGTVTVEPRPGGGSVFRIRIPVPAGQVCRPRRGNRAEPLYRAPTS